MATTGRTIPVSIEDEIKESYLNYAMSVIVSRALPDARDGLKPVHRRILYAMYEMGLRPDRPYKKSGRIVGDVLGKYHPHGDQSIYDSLVRLAQEFSLRYCAVQGQGNFGSVDGDPPAAPRYTEARMTGISEEMLKDIRKETVDFGPNYDESLTEPSVLPGSFPFLLTNGASGIAVGMATNIPPHNLGEVCDAISALIDNPEITVDELIEHVPGPDFPTGGIIFGRRGIADAYKTGKGKIVVRARCVLEQNKKGRDVIIVTEIPYVVNKNSLIVRIADLVRDRKIDGIQDLNDESDRDGMRIVIELKRGATPKVILNQLFSMTQLQQNFNVNSLALVHGKPKALTIKYAVFHYVDHRKEVVIRRTKYDLRKAEEREHILVGLKIALDNIDEVIEIIKASANVDDARSRLMTRFEFSERQAQAILNMQLQRLTNLETQKILDELAEVRKLIANLKDLLSSDTKILGVVRDELEEVRDKFGDERRTKIVADELEMIDEEDLIEEEDMVVVISNRGFVKRVPVSAYRNQGRGGKGASSANLKEDDFVELVFVASTHDHVMFISSVGKGYWMKVHELPEGSRTAKGQHMKALLTLTADEDVSAVLSLKSFDDDTYVFMGTARGVVKKVRASAFSNAKTRGIIALRLDPGDKLIRAYLTRGGDHVILISRHGRTLRFSEDQVRAMGRTSRGVRGIRLTKADELASALCIYPDEQMLFISENGFGKRIDYENFAPHGRGTGGQMGYKVNEKTGELVGAINVTKKDELMCMTGQGNAVKLKIAQIPVFGRAAMGVKIVNIEKPDCVVGVARVCKE